MISYQISFPNPNNHLFHVALLFTAQQQETLTLTLPNWIRGSYMIRDFARNLVSLQAFCNDQPLKVTKLNKSSWSLAACQGQVRIEYEVYALDLSVRSAHLDNTHAFFNGTSLYLAVEEKKHEKIEIHIQPPNYMAGADWSVKTSLATAEVNEAGYGVYRADNYEEAIDHPVEISRSVDIAFNVFQMPHYMHFTGDLPTDIDTQRLVEDLSAICCEHQALFDREPVLDQYRFLTMVVENGYGGLEHKKSTALVCAPGDIPVKRKTDESAYRRFLGLCSHEYFHLWNVKRITPGVFQSSDLSGEAHSTLLWAFEGITSYYDDLAMLRSGRVSLTEYLGLLAEIITRYLRAEGRTRQTLADSSFDAWTKFYKQDENAVNAVVSYYTKGALVAFGLDMQIRSATRNTKSLDDIMRMLWRQYGAIEKGIADEEFELLVQEEAGVDLTGFFDLTLRSTTELPLQDWLGQLGFVMQVRPEQNDTDNGGYAEAIPLDEKDATPLLSWGCKLKPGTTDIQFVYNHSPAELAGIAPGDSLIAIDGSRVKPDNFAKLVNMGQSGMPVEVFVFRRERLHQFQVTPQERRANTCTLSLAAEETLQDGILSRRQQWMTSRQT